MATIINTPGTAENSSGMGLVIGLILAVVIIGLFFLYGLPAIRGQNRPQATNIQVQLPAIPNPNPMQGGGGANQ